MASFYEGEGDMDIGEGGSAPAAPTSDSDQAAPGPVASAQAGKINIVSGGNNDDDDSSDEDGQAFFAGGSQHSGNVVSFLLYLPRISYFTVF